MMQGCKTLEEKKKEIKLRYIPPKIKKRNVEVFGMK